MAHEFTFKTLLFASLFSNISVAAVPAHAAVPEGIDYQACLTKADSSPLVTNMCITIAIYTVDIGGIPLWRDSRSVSVDQRLFSIAPGNPTNLLPN